MTEALAAMVALGMAVGAWIAFRSLALLGGVFEALRSIDSELFHIAQLQDPRYGLCSRCGSRAAVRHVVHRGSNANSEREDELFYCSACWWLSSDMEMGDDTKFYKDRKSDRDRFAAQVGPG